MSSQFDLSQRTFDYAQSVRNYVWAMPKEWFWFPDINQLIRSSGSVGANYIEANEALGRNDFYMRMKICLKEAKESYYWLKLLEKAPFVEKNKVLQREAEELTKIFAAIIRKSKDHYS